MGKWLGVADEVTFGTPVTPPTHFYDCLSISMKPETEVATAESSNFPGAMAKAVGGYKVTGEIEVCPNSSNMSKLLRYLLGTPTSTQDATSGRWLHKYYPSDTLKFGTLYAVDEAQPESPATNALQYISSIVTEMRMECARNAFASMRFSTLSLKDAKVAKPTAGTFNTVKQFFSLDAKMYYDITDTLQETNVASISFTYAREIPDDYMSMSERFNKAWIPGAGKAEGSADIIWKDWTAQEKFWGATSGPVSGQPAEVGLSFKLIGPTLGGAGDYQYHMLRVRLPTCVLTSIDRPYEGRDYIQQTINFECARGSVGGQTSVMELALANLIADTLI